jgi:DNA-binding MarR family transcriptional regulator
VKRNRHELQEAISLAWRRAQNRGDAYDEAVADVLGVNRTDFRCLDILDQEGDPVPAGRLAELMGLTTGATTAMIDRLEEAGYVARIRDPGDRRRVFVERTALAEQRGWEYYGPMAEAAEKHYSRYTVAQLELVLDFLEAGAELSERELVRLRTQLASGQ